MPHGTSGINTKGPFANSDRTFVNFVWNDPNVTCLVGMPVYKDVTDSAEFNTLMSTTALPASSIPNNATGGRVVSGTHINASVYPVGIYQPTDQTTTASASATIQCQVYGQGQVLGAAKASGTAVTVGVALIADATQTACLAASSPSAGKMLGFATATGQNMNSSGVVTSASNNSTANGSSIIAVPGSGTNTLLINAFITIA